MIIAEWACPENIKYLIEQTSSSRYTVACRVDALSSHLEDALAERISKFSHYSFAIDASADMSDTAQMGVPVMVGKQWILSKFWKYKRVVMNYCIVRQEIKL